MEEFKIIPLHIAIKILTIDGKKLTKSVFSQIESKELLTNDLNFKGDQIMGFVKDKSDRYLIWTIDGLVRKTNLSRYYSLRDSTYNVNFDNIWWFCRLSNIDYNEPSNEKYKLVDCINDLKDYNEKVDKVKEFLNQIKDDMQLFL